MALRGPAGCSYSTVVEATEAGFSRTWRPVWSDLTDLHCLCATEPRNWPLHIGSNRHMHAPALYFVVLPVPVARPMARNLRQSEILLIESRIFEGICQYCYPDICQVAVLMYAHRGPKSWRFESYCGAPALCASDFS